MEGVLFQCAVQAARRGPRPLVVHLLVAQMILHVKGRAPHVPRHIPRQRLLALAPSQVRLMQRAVPLSEAVLRRTLVLVLG